MEVRRGGDGHGVPNVDSVLLSSYPGSALGEGSAGLEAQAPEVRLSRLSEMEERPEACLVSNTCPELGCPADANVSHVPKSACPLACPLASSHATLIAVRLSISPPVRTAARLA
jgi:hypothetical protein